jgi:catechol 2,3-dioxygenase-like lactoylglutathione lyase family enzyme
MRAVALDHVVLEVADVERSLRFYRDMLGLPVERLDQFRAGAVGFPSLRVGPLVIDLFPSANPGPGPHHFCLEVDVPAAELVQALDEAAWPHDPPARRWGAKGEGLSVYVQDPDGHRVELRTYRDVVS